MGTLRGSASIAVRRAANVTSVGFLMTSLAAAATVLGNICGSGTAGTRAVVGAERLGAGPPATRAGAGPVKVLPTTAGVFEVVNRVAAGGGLTTAGTVGATGSAGGATAGTSPVPATIGTGVDTLATVGMSEDEADAVGTGVGATAAGVGVTVDGVELSVGAMLATRSTMEVFRVRKNAAVPPPATSTSNKMRRREELSTFPFIPYA